jgi:hypothetical protein
LALRARIVYQTHLAKLLAERLVLVDPSFGIEAPQGAVWLKHLPPPARLFFRLGRTSRHDAPADRRPRRCRLCLNGCRMFASNLGASRVRYIRHLRSERARYPPLPFGLACPELTGASSLLDCDAG